MGKLKKWLPLLIIVSGFAFAYFMGWFKYLNPQLLVENADYLQNLVSDNFILVFLGFIALYAILTVFMLPASILTVASGFLFGVYAGAPAVVVGATIGACGLFVAAKSSLQDTLKGIAGPFISKMETSLDIKSAKVYLIIIITWKGLVPIRLMDFADCIIPWR